MARRKTNDEVQAEIVALRELLPQMPASRRGIQAAITVLAEALSHNDVYDRFEEGTEVFEDANSARMWRDGDSSSDALSAQWREML